MRRIFGRTLILCALVAIGGGLAAAEMYTYIVVLHDRTAADEQGEPDIGALGGELLHRSEDRRVVRVPAPAARTLAAHRAVKYMQRVQLGGDVPPLLEPPAIAATAVAANDWTPPTWASGHYVYDGAANITAIGTAANPASDGGTETYVYDSAGRLVSASVAHGATQSEQYSYDSFGNLVATARTADPSTSTPASAASNRLTTVTYDSAGNVTANESGSTEYQYDSFNMLRAKATSTGTAWYVYTADDERIGASENSVQRWMIRDLSGKVLREWRDAGLVWMWREDHIYRNGALAAAEREPAEGGTRHFHLDHLGTPRLITDQAKAKIALHDYFPFGVEKTDFRQEMLERGTKWPEPMKFTGHERDFTGGISTDNRNQLDYMHARYYSAVWGRFLSPDPIDGVPENPQSWNRFTYALHKPMTLADPYGLYPCDVKTPSGTITVECVSPPPDEDDAHTDRAIYGMIHQMYLSMLGRIVMIGEEGARSHNNAVLDHVGYHNYVECFAAGDCINGREWLEQNQMPFIGGSRKTAFAKAARLIYGARYTRQQSALIELAKEAQRRGASKEEAMQLIKWAKEYGIPYQNHIGTNHWIGGAHIRIGNVNHIRVY